MGLNIPVMMFVPEAILLADAEGIDEESNLATIIPQSPKKKLEKIVADADLNLLSREDYFRCNENLRDELAYMGNVYSDAKWFSDQLCLIKSMNILLRVAVYKSNM